MHDLSGGTQTDRVTGFLANVACRLQILADCLLAEFCYGANGISGSRRKWCRTHLGRDYEPVVMEDQSCVGKQGTRRAAHVLRRNGIIELYVNRLSNVAGDNLEASSQR
jgi:hypothetical protein